MLTAEPWPSLVGFRRLLNSSAGLPHRQAPDPIRPDEEAEAKTMKLAWEALDQPTRDRWLQQGRDHFRRQGHDTPDPFCLTGWARVSWWLAEGRRKSNS